MKTVRDQPAIQVLAKNLAGKTGQPILIILEETKDMTRYTGVVPKNTGHMHSPRVYIELTYIFGILQNDTLMEDTSSGHTTSLGINFKTHGEKREEYDDTRLEEGPFWLSANGDQLAFCSSQACVLIGAEEIANWTRAEAFVQQAEKRIRNFCLLAAILNEDPQQWPPIKTHITELTTQLYNKAVKIFAVLQQEMATILENETTAGTLKSATEKYKESSRLLHELTGENLPWPVDFPLFAKPQN